MGKKILFVGAGAIGSYLGSFFQRAGHDVTIVDPWHEQVETINAKGISVTGPHDPFVAKPKAVHLNDAAKLPRNFDIGFVAMKAYDTEWAAQLVWRHVRRDGGYVVSSQNTWPDPTVARMVGQENAVGLIMSRIGVALWKAGTVERGMEGGGGGTGHIVFRAGEHDGKITPRVKEVAELLSLVDGATTTDNLWGERWAKLCQNSMGNPVQAMSGLGSFEIASSEVGRAITIHLGSESARVGLAAGHKIVKFGGLTAEEWADANRRERWDAIDKMLTPQAGGSKRNWKASMAQDVAKGRPTEIDFMNGHVVAQGKERGVPTPVSQATVEIVREIDAGTRKQDPKNIELVLKKAGV